MSVHILTSVGESTSFAEKCSIGKAARRKHPLEAFVTEAGYGVPLPLVEVGVSRLDENWNGTILEDIEIGETVYFVHSFTAAPENLANRLADTYYNGQLISAAVQSGSLYGCQFHPEKSGVTGLKIINNFIKQKVEP